MELLTNPQTSYLLQADLAALHTESQSWLQEIEFWEDELAFFYKLLHSKFSSQAYPTEEIAALDKTLVGINSDKLTTVKELILNHERSLALALQSTSMQEEDSYRHAHRPLNNKMAEVYAVIKEFKQNVYSFVRKYEPK